MSASPKSPDVFRTGVLVGLIVFAGCLGIVDPRSGTPDSGTPDSGSPTAGPPDAAWATGTGLDGTALAHAHFAVLREAGNFTVNRSDVVRVGGDVRPQGPGPDGYYPPSYARKQVDLANGRYLDRYVTVGQRRIGHFITPAVIATRRRPCPDCATEYSYQRRPEGDTSARRIDRFRRPTVVEGLNRSIYGVTVGFEYTFGGTVQRGDETLYRYRAERTLDTAPPPFAEPPRGTATILVTADGVVRRFTLRYSGVATVTVEGERRTVDVSQTFERRYTAVGDTVVQRPGWVDHAAASDTPRPTETGGTNDTSGERRTSS